MQGTKSGLVAFREALLCEVRLEIRVRGISHALCRYKIRTNITGHAAGRNLVPDLPVTAGRLIEDRDRCVVSEGGHQLARGTRCRTDIDIRPADDRRLCRVRGRKCIQRGSGRCQQKAERKQRRTEAVLKRFRFMFFHEYKLQYYKLHNKTSTVYRFLKHASIAKRIINRSDQFL